MKYPRSSGKPKRRKLLVVRRIVGSSMEPTFRAGQLVLASGFAKPRDGDVVIFQHDGLEKIKRLQHTTNGTIYVVGDNAAGSTDSRAFGALPETVIIATVVWPRRRTMKPTTK